MFGLPWGVLIVAVIVTVLSAGRLTRLVVADSWPPVLWFKAKWDTWTDKNEHRQGWWVLLSCPWCLGPWFTLLVGGWAVVDALIDGVIDWPWWAFNGWLALSYLTSMVVFHDEGKDDGAG